MAAKDDTPQTHSKVDKEMKKCSAKAEEEKNTAASENGFPAAALFENNGNESYVRKPTIVKQTPSAIPKKRQELLKWNGWGYQDSQFEVKDGMIYFTGDRYPIGQLRLPYMTQWVKDVFNADLNLKIKPRPLPKPEEYPSPLLHQGFMTEFQQHQIAHSVEGLDRLVRAHGHTLHDIYELRLGHLPRLPDLVIWPDCHNDVVKIVQLATKHNIVIIPFGGGTSVSRAVCCPPYEKRMIISLDTSQMNRVLWVDKENLVACCEAGIFGQDLDRELKKHGLITGHEPDSQEFSSLGGWVATRASGMKKNVYGNIEDLVVHVRMVTPTGVLEKPGQVPRMSCGPDFNHVILGSEGTLGVITEVILKVRPQPACKKYGSIVFPNFESGVHCMREVARRRCQPASIRLVDNEQFKFGQMLRAEPGFVGSIFDGLKRIYVTKFKGFDVHKMCVATLVFEGDQKDVELQEKKIYQIASNFGGMPAGETNGERGYMLTFVIAYIRDLGLSFNVVAESFETSVPWDRTLLLCRNVKNRVAQECKARNIKHYLMSCRVTQTYDAGSCVYFYFAFQTSGISDPVKMYEEIETAARDEILLSGGSLSHHHGVGKVRQKWFPQQVSPLGVGLYQAVKQQLDPANIFASGNLVNDTKPPLKSSL